MEHSVVPHHLLSVLRHPLLVPPHEVPKHGHVQGHRLVLVVPNYYRLDDLRVQDLGDHTVSPLVVDQVQVQAVGVVQDVGLCPSDISTARRSFSRSF